LSATSSSQNVADTGAAKQQTSTSKAAPGADMQADLLAKLGNMMENKTPSANTVKRQKIKAQPQLSLRL